MKKRIITGIGIVVIMGPLLYLGGYFSLALCAFLSYFAGVELFNLFILGNTGLKKYKYIFPILGVILVALFSLVSQRILPSYLIYLVFGIEILLSFLICLFDYELKMHDLGDLLTILVYAGFMFGCLNYLRYINQIGDYQNPYLGLFITLYVIICAFGTDVMAYFGGKLFGKHPLWPSVSPKKTIEGSIIGTLFATAIASSFALIIFKITGFTNYPGWVVMVVIGFSFLLSIISQLGDLTASKFKRDYGIKDFGKLFPGHGGVLDRFDSLIMISTVFFALLMIFGIVQ